MKYGLLFISSPFYEYSNLEYEHVPVYYRVVQQAEYVIHVIVAASQECVNTYSTCRHTGLKQWLSPVGLRVNPSARRLLQLGLYKIFVYVEAVGHESTILSFPPSTCIAHPAPVLLHDYWTVYDSPSDLPCVCYTPHTFGNTNSVQRPSCNRVLTSTPPMSCDKYIVGDKRPAELTTCGLPGVEPQIVAVL